jgi:hypothetical protein
VRLAALERLNNVEPRTKSESDRTVRVGVVGIGQRGAGLIRILLQLDNVEVRAVADAQEDNVLRGQKLCADAGREKPVAYSDGPQDYRGLVEREDLDAVITAAPWEWHVPVVLAALDAGKYAMTEVPAAVTVDECWQLVEKCEETGLPCMMMENDCFRRDMLAMFNLCRGGLLGEVFHCESGYNHDVRYVKFNTQFEDTGALGWRGWHSVHRDGNLYPTHQLGPAALIMDIDRGTRMEYLVSMSTPSHGMGDYIAERFGEDHPNARRSYKNGDVNVTLIKLENGNTLTQYHDTQAWRPLDEFQRFHGTKGIMEKPTISTPGQIFTIERHWDRAQTNDWEWHELEPFLTEFEHPLWRRHGDRAGSKGHGGSDFMTLRAFVEAVRYRTQTPLTVYDAVSWSVVAPLSEQSVTQGSRPVEFPDFTRGKWRDTPPFEMRRECL